MRGVALALVGALLLAGCSGDAPKGSVDNVFEGLEEDVAVTASTGSIAGVVVDAAIRPLAGANVTLMSDGAVSTSGEDGRFSFEGLEPGAYFLSASAHRHDAAQVSVDVLAGEVSTVRVLLAASTSIEPYHITIQFHGHIDNYLGYGQFVVEVVAPGTLACQCVFTYTPEANMSTMVLEAVGEAAIPNPGTPATVPGDAYWELLIGEALQDSAYSEFPILERWDEDIRETPDESYSVRITGGVWPSGTMDYDVFITLWYHEPAPDGWSFVAENS